MAAKYVDALIRAEHERRGILTWHDCIVAIMLAGDLTAASAEYIVARAIPARQLVPVGRGRFVVNC